MPRNTVQVGARARLRSVVVIAAAVLAGCSTFPLPPEDLPATFIPEVAPTTRDVSGILDEVLSETEGAVYMLQASGCGVGAQGTAFAVSPDTLVTNHHVIAHLTRDSSIVEVRGPAGILQARVTWVSPDADLALLSVEGDESLPHVAPLATQDVEPGQQVTMVGYPGGFPQRTTIGAVVLIGPLPDSPTLPVLEFNADGAPGSSGSPVFNADGEVVGVLRAQNGWGYGVAVPVSVLRSFLDDPGASGELPSECAA